jgi:hypothetical protein
MKQIKLFPVMPTIGDSTSYYRGQLPVADLSLNHDVGLIYSTDVSWATMVLAHVLVLQRPFTAKEHIVMAQVCEKAGRKLWCDWDDDLFSVPEDNPVFPVYSQPEVQSTVATLAAMANAVTVSTEDLKKRFDNIRERASLPPCTVIPNALSDHLIPKREKREPERRKLIFWRGSGTHQRDLMTITEPLIEIMNSRPDWTIHFLGYNPFWITQCIPKKQCIVGQGLDILDYHAYFGKIQPGITIVPLADCEFNHSKSNCAWLEATYAHSQVVAPNFTEWHKPGILNYTDPVGFATQLKFAMEQVEAQDWTPVEASWNFIMENLLLSQVNQKRLELLKSLCPHKS